MFFLIKDGLNPKKRITTQQKICNAALPEKACPVIGTGEGIETFYESYTSLTHSCHSNSKFRFLSFFWVWSS